MAKRDGDFSKKTMQQEWRAANNRCRVCGFLLEGKPRRYDHKVPLWLWPPDKIHLASQLSNCQVLCVGCHCLKTGEEAPVRAKCDRLAHRAAGIPQKKKTMLGSRNSGWKRKMNGEVVRRDE